MIRLRYRLGAATAALLVAGVSLGVHSGVEQKRGIDPRVNYQALSAMGPWDDRNYLLNAEDLDLLADNEAELRNPIPAFYRVHLRRQYPEMSRQGPVQYPRKALNYFRRDNPGYLIDGQVYSKVTWQADGYQVKRTDPLPLGALLASFFSGVEAVVNGPGAGAAESAVAINPQDGDRVIAGVNEIGQGMYWSDDGGHSWQAAGGLEGNECCDPSLAWSATGQYAYAATLGGARQVWFYRSDNGGQTWDGLGNLTPGDVRREIAGRRPGLSDKEYLHVDQWPESPFYENIYLTFHEQLILHVATSSDFGNSFNLVALDDDVRGIGSDITSDSQGRVYHFWPGRARKEIRLGLSLDGGQSFEPSTLVADINADFAVPLLAMETREAFVYVSAGADLSGGPYHDRVYVAWTDTLQPDDENNPAANHALIRVAFSDDAGQSWQVRSPHSLTDVNWVDRFHPWLAVAPNGDVLVAYYDTRHSLNRSGVDFYLARSTDGGESWRPARRLTSVTSANIDDNFEWGDYNGLDVGPSGAIAIFTDNRVDPEDSNSLNQVDVYTSTAFVGALFASDFEVCSRHPGRCERVP